MFYRSIAPFIVSHIGFAMAAVPIAMPKRRHPAMIMTTSHWNAYNTTWNAYDVDRVRAQRRVANLWADLTTSLMQFADAALNAYNVDRVRVQRRVANLWPNLTNYLLQFAGAASSTWLSSAAFRFHVALPCGRFRWCSMDVGGIVYMYFMFVPHAFFFSNTALRPLTWTYHRNSVSSCFSASE